MTKRVFLFKCIRTRDTHRWTADSKRLYVSADGIHITDDNGEYRRAIGIIGGCVAIAEADTTFVPAWQVGDCVNAMFTDGTMLDEKKTYKISSVKEGDFHDLIGLENVNSAYKPWRFCYAEVAT